MVVGGLPAVIALLTEFLSDFKFLDGLFLRLTLAVVACPANGIAAFLALYLGVGYGDGSSSAVETTLADVSTPGESVLRRGSRDFSYRDWNPCARWKE